VKGKVGTVCAMALNLCFHVTLAQHQQLWLDYQLSYPFANQYLLEMTTSYQTVLTETDKWRSFSVSPTFEYMFLSNLDLIVEVPVGYTLQAEDYNSFETILSLGARWHITQNRRVNVRLLYRTEKRFFKNLEENTWDSSTRGRLKAETTISINGPNLYQDNLWWAILDYEEFFVADEQVNERYANRRRGRVGLGYRLNYKHRFEVIYTLQSSRNEIEGEFISNDNILQLRYKMYLNPSKPVKETNTIPD